MSLLLLAGTLLLAPPDPSAGAEATHPVWAGGRPWTACREREQQAEVILKRVSTRTEEPSSSEAPWSAAARECPNAPAVLVLAAMRELLNIPPLPPQGDLVAALPELAEAHRSSRLQARKWLVRAQVEARRRGEAPPLMTHYFVAYAALGLGEADVARAALIEAERRGEVEPWRTERLSAVAALLAGDLKRALTLAYRARELAPAGERQTSVHVMALVYDRAGAPEAAQRELSALRQQDGERLAIDTLLPLHERLYLLALDQQARKNLNIALRLWEAYLACPEPEAPERELATRRQAELRPRGSVVPTTGPRPPSGV
jgi:hypothetical protein